MGTAPLCVTVMSPIIGYFVSYALPRVYKCSIDWKGWKPEMKYCCQGSYG